MSGINSGAKTFRALLERNLFVFKKRFSTYLIQAVVALALTFTQFRFLMPAMGLPVSRIMPLFLSSITVLMFRIGFGSSVQFIHDLESRGFFLFQVLTPLSLRGLIAQRVLYFILISTLIIFIPLLGGVGLLYTIDPFPLVHLISFTLFYFLCALFFGMLFTFMPLICSFRFFMNSIWPRFLTPLFLLAATNVTWYDAYALNKPLSYLLLLNPLTYVPEGLRASLYPDRPFIPLIFCTGVLLFWCVILWLILPRAASSRLDLPHE